MLKRDLPASAVKSKLFSLPSATRVRPVRHEVRYASTMLGAVRMAWYLTSLSLQLRKIPGPTASAGKGYLAPSNLHSQVFSPVPRCSVLSRFGF